jgi:hypothetical protein
MARLLQKLSYFDPETGGTFVDTGDKFLWKEGKKHPEDSKVTKLVRRYGWKLVNGNDAWLIFEKKGNDGELFVVRGNKRWFYDLPEYRDLFGAAMKGKGLDSLYDALEKNLLTEELADKVASPAATAVNNAGNGHSQVDGDPLPEIHVWGSKLLQAREPMHDDSGALTGLRRRPDYGESDSFTSIMNEENSKSACLVLEGKNKTAATKVSLYITAVEYEKGRALKLANFAYSPDPLQAKVFRIATAENLVKQIRGLCGAVAKLANPNNLIKKADESTLNGFTIMSLEDFVEGNEPQTKSAAPVAEVEEEEQKAQRPEPGEVKRDEPATKDDFGFGAQTRELSDEEVKDWMKRVKEREKQEYKEKSQTKEWKQDKYNLPILHAGNIHIVDDGGKEYDLERLKKQIMQRPDRLLRKNEKMQHSDGTATQFYNLGLPALKGLAINEKTGKFVVVDTCPGAGACKLFCYALRGNYVRLPTTSMFQSKVLNFLVNQPEKFKNLLKAEITVALNKAGEDEKVVVRWHDAGDFFSPEYMNMAYSIARDFPDVSFYAYTKVADVANSKKPENFIVNFSEGAKPSETKRVDLTQIKKSVAVPQKMFWDLIVTKGAHVVKDKSGQVQFKSEKAWEEFKNRLADTYQAPKDTLLLYNDYIKKKQNDELGTKPKWQVVVPPGAGDQAANDPTVLVSFLMWH